MENLAASVHARLLNEARKTGRPFNELLQYYAMERFLYRLSENRFGSRFVLKGALMLVVWNAPLSRPTKDIDLLGRGLAGSVEDVARIVRSACEQRMVPDGLVCDAQSVSATRIAEHAEYEGVRVGWQCSLGNARVTLQLDVGFGDSVLPGPYEITYPTILNFPPPRLLAYSRESVVAEKFQAMVRLGEINSRMNDFFDVWLLARHFQFAGDVLAEAIGETFRNRDTEIHANPFPLSTEFSGAAIQQDRWTAFVRRTRLDSVPASLADVIVLIERLLGPIAHALAHGRSFWGTWDPPGPWRTTSHHRQ